MAPFEYKRVLGSALFLGGVLIAAVACSDDENPQPSTPNLTGGTGAGAAGGAGGTGGASGSAGTGTGGTGGGTGGTGGTAGTGGSGGTTDAGPCTLPPGPNECFPCAPTTTLEHLNHCPSDPNVQCAKFDNVRVPQ